MNVYRSFFSFDPIPYCGSQSCQDLGTDDIYGRQAGGFMLRESVTTGFASVITDRNAYSRSFFIARSRLNAIAASRRTPIVRITQNTVFPDSWG